MANPSKGLGRGLAALLGDDVMTPEEEKTLSLIHISEPTRHSIVSRMPSSA